MAEEGKAPPSPAAADAHLFGQLSNLLHQVESLTNQEKVELRAKIEALGLDVRKHPSKSGQHLNEVEIAKELNKLSAKLDHVDELISSTMAEDPQVHAHLSTAADVWMQVITATSDERRTFTSTAGEDGVGGKGQNSETLLLQNIPI